MRKLYQWERDVLDLREAGSSWRSTAREIQSRYKEMQPLTELTMIRKCRNVLEKLERHELHRASAASVPVPDNADLPGQEALISALTKGADIQTLAQQLHTSERVAEAMIQDIKDQGYNVQEDAGEYRLSKIAPPQENRVKETWAGERIIRFGLISDSHLNSKYTQITFLHELYDTFQAEGLSMVYHAGDMDEGERMRPGHQYECYTQGADDHIQEIVRVYPKRDGIITKYILGNHDGAFIKHVGLDIGPQISSLRSDMIYLGQSAAMIQLTDGCTLELRHPGDGSAYAVSYKIQKMIDAMSGGEKPSILAVGHYHKSEYLFYRNIHAFQAGTTCAQTPWMRSKQISAHMGGWIIEAHVNDDGTIRRIKKEFIPCYKAIKDDYKKWDGVAVG